MEETAIDKLEEKIKMMRFQAESGTVINCLIGEMSKEQKHAGIVESKKKATQ